MTVRLAINGFGRMGRLAFRVAWDHPDLDVVLINDPGCDAPTSAHLLTFDSIHGTWPRSCSGDARTMTVASKQIRYTQTAHIADLPLAELAVDMILECSGVFKTAAQLAPYFEAGVCKVIVSAPLKQDGLNLVMGVNDHLYDPAIHHIVTAASCTTNCLAPVVKVIHEGLGIRHGSMTTIHDITNTQIIVDKGHKDLRRARACGQSLIPTSTGSARAITRIFPELTGKLNGHAVRVPLLNASLTDFVFEAARTVTVDEVNGYFKAAAEGDLKGILGYEERPLVSVDYLNDPRSSIVDALSTMVIDDTQVKIYAWYDNEWGYVNRMMDLAVKLAKDL